MTDPVKDPVTTPVMNPGGDPLTGPAGHGGTEPAPSLPVAAWRGFQRLKQVGFPARFPLAQFPNEPLIAALVAGQVAKYVHGTSHGAALAVAQLGMAVWAYEELTQGVNWVRRLLGLTFTVLTVINLANRLS